jgi:hypothetical protein
MDNNRKRILNYLLGRLEDLMKLDDEISKGPKLQVLADLEELNDPDSLPVLRGILEDKTLKLDPDVRKAVHQTAKTVYTTHFRGK